MKFSLTISLLLLSSLMAGCLAPPKRPTAIAGKNHKSGDDLQNGGGTGTGNGTGIETGGGEGTGGGGTGAGGGEGGMGGGEGGGGTGTGGGTETGGGDDAPKGPALQTSERFDEVVWLTAHNAFVNDDDAAWKAVNQSRSMQFQLDNGVTAFMLDIYSFENRRLMCHGSCDGIEDPIFKKKIRVPGVHEQMDLVPSLKVFNAYLDKHKDAFVTLILEDYMTPADLGKSLDEVPGMRDKIFNPYKWDVMGKGWPRLDALRKDNKRLFIISDRSDKKDLGVAYAQDFTRENYWSLNTEDKKLDYSCKPRWKGKELNEIAPKFQYLTVMNHFRDIPYYKTSAEDNKWDLLWNRLNGECLKVYQRRINYLAVDHFDEADWGARKVVEELRLNGITLYKDKGLKGPMRLLKEGKYLAKDVDVGDNQLSSIKVNAGYRIKIYDDDKYQNLLGEYTEDVHDLGDKAKKTTSIIVERK